MSKDCDFHPPYICDLCRKKLQRYRKAKNKKAKFQVTINLVTWEHPPLEQNLDVDGKEYSRLAEKFNFLYWKCSGDYYFVRLDQKSCITTHKLVVDSSRQWQLEVNSLSVKPERIEEFHTIPLNLNLQALDNLLGHLNSMTVCPGNEDFVGVLEDRGGSVKNKEGNLIAVIDSIANKENSASHKLQCHHFFREAL